MDIEKLKNAPVAVTGCGEYDDSGIEAILRAQFAAIGAGEEFFRGRRVLLKPNLVSAKDPSFAVTTHPAVVAAVFRIVRDMGAADVILAESPGGSYAAPFLNKIYAATGMKDLSEREGLPLNRDLSSRPVPFLGKKLNSIEVIAPVVECDVIVNICKLKTHSLTGLSCAVKNLFGVIPGIVKFEMHAAYPELSDFCEMLCDLDMTLYRDHDILSVCDAIVAMEGNGPTHGTPVPMGRLLSSLSTFALDVVAEREAGIGRSAKYLDIAAERGIVKRDDGDIAVVRVDVPEEPAKLELPDSKKGNSFSMKILASLPNLFGGRFSRFFEPRPRINKKKCVGCGNCVSVCPQKTIITVKKKGKRLAKIKRGDCIRCFCCQELCPHGAVDTVKNPILKLIR